MRKKVLTRRRMALRWCCVALVLVAACLWLLPWNLTPEAAHRRTVKGKTGWSAEVVCGQAAQLDSYLVVSFTEEIVTLGGYEKRHGLFWESIGMDVVTREAERPFAADYFDIGAISSDGIKTDYYYLFGILQDEGVERIQINFQADTGGHDQEVMLTDQDWIITDTGERCFLYALEPEVDNYARTIYAKGYLTNGTVTQTYYLTSPLGWE